MTVTEWWNTLRYLMFIISIKHALGKRSVINKSGFWDLGWADSSMVTIHETKMIFLLGKIPMWARPARLWQDILKYISLCVGALHRNYQGIASGECLRIVLEQALESSLTENLSTWHFITNFADFKEDLHLFLTDIPCSWPPVPSSFCLGSPKNLSVSIVLGDTTLSVSSGCTSQFHPTEKAT